MDTNYPACTPREGYPVEIQALWIRLLQQLEKIGEGAEQKKWRELAARATALLEKFFWLEDTRLLRRFVDCQKGQSAAGAKADDALRSNYLFAVSLGLVTGERAKRCVEAAQKYLVVPGALRSLAPLPVSVPLPICADGQFLNNPVEPYCAALRRRRGHAPQAGLSQRHGVDVDISGFLRSAGAGVGFFTGSGGGGQGISRQHGAIDERGLSWTNSRNPRRRRPAHAARLRRAGLGRDRGVARVEIAGEMKFVFYARPQPDLLPQEKEQPLAGFLVL